MAEPARPSVTKARSAVATSIRYGHDPARIEAARRDLAEAKLERHIREIVDSAPPLTDEQRSRLALLLSPGAGNAAT